MADQEKEPESMCIHVRRAAVALIVLLGLVPPFGQARGDSWTMTVRGGDVDLGETPVVLHLKEPLPVGLYAAESPSAGGTFLAQVFEDKAGRWLGVVFPRIEARQTVTYVLKQPETGGPAAPAGIQFEPHDHNLMVKLDQQLLTEYHVGIGNKPFFFPLVGPTGDSYTRTYPLVVLPEEDHDHPHQRSCWFTFGKVNGVDFWSEGKRFGTIQETGRTLVAPGPVVGRMVTTNEWRAADDRRFCRDERTVTFYRTRATRIIDFSFRIIASDGPVTFGDTKEGMFGIRVASSMDVNRKQGGRITNAEGLTDEKAWGKPSPWVDYVGPVKDKIVGITIINHPLSFRYPTTWHVRTYGLFAANPFGWHDFGRPERGDYTIPGGQAIDFSYRVVLHEGDTKAANVPALASGFITPPVVELRKD